MTSVRVRALFPLQNDSAEARDRSWNNHNVHSVVGFFVKFMVTAKSQFEGTRQKTDFGGFSAVLDRSLQRQTTVILSLKLAPGFYETDQDLH